MHVKNRYILICKFSTLEIDRYWISFVLFAEFLKGNDSLKLMINKKVFFCSPKPSKQVTRRLHGYKEDPYIFMDEKDPMWDPIRFDSILKQNDRQKSLQKHIVRVISLIVYDLYQMMTYLLLLVGIFMEFLRTSHGIRSCTEQKMDKGGHSILCPRPSGI